MVSTSYPREEGDPAGAFVAGFAGWLARSGALVDVVAAGPGAARVDGIDVRRVDGRGLFYAGGAPDALATGSAQEKAGAWLRAAAFQAALVGEVARRAAAWDGVVTHWVVPSALAVEAVVAAAAVVDRLRSREPRVPVPHLAIAHSSDVWLLRRSKAGRALLRTLAGRADLVYAGAHLAVAGAPGRVVPMGIDASACRGERARGRARFMLQSSKGRPVALFLGRLVPIKGLDLLLAALPPELDLVVAGAGPLRDTWQRRAPPRVRFVGEVRGADKGDLLAAADLLVVPSLRLRDGREEGTPTVILEGLAAGLPIVATRTGGAEAVLEGRPNAFLVEPAVGPLRAALLAATRGGASGDRFPSARATGVEAGERFDWSRVGPILAMTFTKLLTV